MQSACTPLNSCEQSSRHQCRMQVACLQALPLAFLNSCNMGHSPVVGAAKPTCCTNHSSRGYQIRFLYLDARLRTPRRPASNGCAPVAGTCRVDPCMWHVHQGKHPRISVHSDSTKSHLLERVQVLLEVVRWDPNVLQACPDHLHGYFVQPAVDLSWRAYRFAGSNFANAAGA